MIKLVKILQIIKAIIKRKLNQETIKLIDKTIGNSAKE